MKRGFLLRSEERKAAALRRGTQKQSQPVSESSTAVSHAPPSQPPRKGYDAGKGNVASDDAAPGNNGLIDFPLSSDPNAPMFVFKESDPDISKLAEQWDRLTSIPHVVPDNEIQCQWLVTPPTKEKVFNSPGYPARIPKPSRPDLCQVRSTPVMGKGLFAKHDIKRGALIFAERPLLVTPNKMHLILPEAISDPQKKMRMLILQSERMFELAIGRLPLDSQADYKALQNVYTRSELGPLNGISSTNGYDIGDKLYNGSNKNNAYGAVCKIGSRINHSCIPNVTHQFRLNSFSMQFYAIRDIKAGQQLFYSYCASDRSLAQRRTELAPYRFVCQCPACVNATPETDKLRTTFEDQVVDFTNMLLNFQFNKTMLKQALRLEKAMINEGLDTLHGFVGLLNVIGASYEKLGKGKEGANYRLRAEELRAYLSPEAEVEVHIGRLQV